MWVVGTENWKIKFRWTFERVVVLVFHNLQSHPLQHSSSDISLWPSLSIILMWPCEPVSWGHKTLQCFPPRTVSTSEGTKEAVDFANIPPGLPGLAKTGIFNNSPGWPTWYVSSRHPSTSPRAPVIPHADYTRLLALHTLLTEDTFYTK